MKITSRPELERIPELDAGLRMQLAVIELFDKVQANLKNLQMASVTELHIAFDGDCFDFKAHFSDGLEMSKTELRREIEQDARSFLC